jgi:leader peptidase (prepilin peptidase)/N-methyltransferase
VTTPWPIAALLGVLGLAVGSFLNVVIYRVPRAESVVSPPSHCPGCDTPIKGRHNVPVLSWLVLRGHCAACRAPISPRYPLVEAVTGLLFVGVTVRFGLTAELPAFLYLAAVAVALGMIEFDVRRVPDSIVLPSYVVALALLLPAGAVDADWHPGARGLAGGLLLATLMFAFAIAFPNNVAFGNAKLAGLLGLYLGWLSWGALLLGLFGAFAVAAASGGTLSLAAARGGAPGRARAVPLGPCLIAGTVLTVFLAAPVSTWYGSLLAV